MSVLALALLPACVLVLSENKKPTVPVPDRFVIGRDTFFDFGPPSHYVELLLANPSDEGTSIERIILTPGYECTLLPKFEVAKATIKQPVATLFAARNPCTIPEKDLNRELKRGKHELAFSGANISMRFRCGGQTRIIRADVLDKDMFNSRAGTPENTSWTMEILSQLDNALGQGVMDKAAVQLPEDGGGSAPPPDSPVLQEIARGEFDDLFPGTTDKPSQIYLSTRKVIPPPTVSFVRSSPSKPILAPLPQYPALAKAAQVEGGFTFTVDIQSDGRTTNFAAVNGSPLFRAAMQDKSREWLFSSEAAGQRVVVTVQFLLNCHNHK